MVTHNNIKRSRETLLTLARGAVLASFYSNKKDMGSITERVTIAMEREGHAAIETPAIEKAIRHIAVTEGWNLAE